MVSDALEQSKPNEIIENVAVDATPRVSASVVIPKKDGGVRFGMPNQTIQCERHPTLTVDDLIHKLTGGTLFTKLDLRSGLLSPASLADESWHMTICQTQETSQM